MEIIFDTKKTSLRNDFLCLRHPHDPIRIVWATRVSFSIIYQSLTHVGNLDQRNSFVNPLVLAHPDTMVALQSSWL